MAETGTELVTLPGALTARVGVDPVHVYLEGLKSPKTKRTMRQALERCARSLDGKPSIASIPWERLEYEHTSALRSRLAKEFGPQTVSVTMVAVRGVLRTCWRLGLKTHESFASATDWDPLRVSRLPAGRDLSSDELEKLRAFCASCNVSYRAFLDALFALMLGGGLRAAEVCGLPLSSFVPGESRVRLIGKGDKEGYGVLGARETEALSAWLGVRKFLGVQTPWLLVRVHRNGGVAGSGRLTTSALNHLCTDVATAAGMQHFSPHDCRRTYCTRLLSAGLDLATVQRLMRHESPETTAKYDKRQEDADARARQEVSIW